MRKTSSSYASVAQLVEQRTENPRVVGSIPTGGTKFAGVAHPVERHLAKVEVASSSLVTRSIRYRGQVVRQESAKLSLASSNLAGTSKTKRTSIWMSFLFWKNRAVRFEDQKCDCPGTVTCRRLDGGNSSVFVHSRAKMQTNPAGNSRRTRCFCIGFFFGSNRLTYRIISRVPAAMRTHPRMERRVSCSWSSTAARMMVITTLSLSIGATFDTSPI